MYLSALLAHWEMFFSLGIPPQQRRMQTARGIRAMMRSLDHARPAKQLADSIALALNPIERLLLKLLQTFLTFASRTSEQRGGTELDTRLPCTTRSHRQPTCAFPH